MPWVSDTEARVGLGCMRLSTDEDRDEKRALATISAAVKAGITVFDTARSYGQGPAELGHNERLVARGLRLADAESGARIVTKGGMSREGGRWIPDGRAKTLRADCEASLVALDGLPIDLYLVHAPDPRTPWRTSVRALARLVDDGLVGHIGLANVTRDQLNEALELAPITAVEIALSPFDDRALRGGVVERCTETGVTVIAHSPLGGPRRVARLERHEALADAARVHGTSVAEVALAWLLGLAPGLVAIPGARRPETARSAARAGKLQLDDAERARIGGVRQHTPAAGAAGDVIVVMGIPGAGKSRIAEDYVARGYERLNRDERGGSLRELAGALDETLANGARSIVLDNTYLTRAARSYIVDSGSRHGVPVRCVWIETPLAEAQFNLVERLLDRFGSLPTPDELKDAARKEPWLLAPTSQMRALRELEPPSEDEGFALVEHVAFVRTPHPNGGPAVFVAAAALREPGWRRALEEAGPSAPHLVFDWKPGSAEGDLAEAVALLAAAVSGPVEAAICSHPGGPPICWCRPPLPGLPLAFARAHGMDPARSFLVGTSAAHRTLANTLGAVFVSV